MNDNLVLYQTLFVKGMSYKKLTKKQQLEIKTYFDKCTDEVEKKNLLYLVMNHTFSTKQKYVPDEINQIDEDVHISIGKLSPELQHILYNFLSVAKKSKHDKNDMPI